MILRQMIPAVHRHVLPVFFDTPIPEETLATCDRCAMALPEVLPEHTPEGFFRPDVKCCSFHPNLPNFLVGAVLADESPEMRVGRELLRDRMTKRVGVGPFWLSAPRKYTLLFLASRKTSFGRSLILRCPYFNAAEANCSIWRHRDAVCTSFFCRHVNGREGEVLWRAIESVLRHVERRLAEYAANSLGFPTPPAENFDNLTLEELEDRPPNTNAYSELWREWVGREEVFYQACREIVANLDRTAFERAFGDAEMSAAIEKAQWAIERVRRSAEEK